MPLGRYLLIVFAASLALFAAIAYLAPHPEPDPDRLTRTFFGAPVAAVFVVLNVMRAARYVPVDQRTSFRAYRTANRAWVSWTALLGIAAIVMFSGVLHFPGDG